jgi:hypothetical protein
LTESFVDALLLQTTQVAALSKPRNEELMALEQFLDRTGSIGDFKLLERGCQEEDLVALFQPPADDEGIAKMLKPTARAAYRWATTFWRRKLVIRSHDDLAVLRRGGGVYLDRDSKFRTASARFGEACGTAVFCLLPALMILWLNNVTNTQDRIYITIGATASLGFIINICTNANMKEVLSITIG